MSTKQARIPIPFCKEPAYQLSYDNGFTLYFVPKRGEVFNINTWVKTGSIHEDDQNNGVSHFLEHLMFKGTERFKPGEFDRAMESMGAVINAATWKDFTFYYITGPKDSAGNNFATALDMHADMLLHSTIPDGEVGPVYNPDDPNYSGAKRERSVVIEEIGMRNDQPWTKIYNAVNLMMYPDAHPYRRDVIGTRQIIGTIPREDIIRYYRTWYSPKNMTTIVVGDFDLETLEAQVLKCFNFDDVKRHGVSEGSLLEKAPAIPAPNGNRYQTLTGEYATQFLISGFHGPSPNDLEETIALDVVSYVLGEGRSSRLTQELLEKPEKPIFNALSTGQSVYKLGNVFYIQGNFSDISPEEAQKLVWQEVEKLCGPSPITQDEFSRAVKAMKVDFAETSETASSIAESLGESVVTVGDISHYAHYLEALTHVTLEKVNEVARKYLRSERAYTAVMIPEESVSDN
ncbi:MAG: insulinase family protein [Cyanobacteria bacterium]|nr:insulinase family protein [Cyanobacteriota bacterium]